MYIFQRVFVFLLVGIFSVGQVLELPNPECGYDRIESECETVILPEIAGRYVVDADLAKWPYLVSIQQQANGRASDCFQHVCAGVLIHPLLVLTAAHCTDFGTVLGLFTSEGETRQPTYVTRQPACTHQSGGERIEVDYAWKSPEWDRMSTSGDIALLKLSKPFPNYDGPFVNYNQSVTYNLEKSRYLFIAGWGISSDLDIKRITKYTVDPLKQAPVSYVSRDLCYYYLDQFGGRHSRDLLDYETMLCTYSEGADTCQGDSGGPLIAKGKVPWEDIVLGIVSWGPPEQCVSNEAQQAPSIFARVSRFVSWIEEIVNKVDVQIESNGSEKSEPNLEEASKFGFSQISFRPLYFDDDGN